MLNEPQSLKYIVEFFGTGNKGARPADTVRLKADDESEAIEQANWLARHTRFHHFQVRAVSGVVHSIIYQSSALARAA